MAFKRSSLVLSAVALIAMSACTAVDSEIKYGGQYWQRLSVSEAVYQRGPKAQQMLNRDIARCVTELRELERLGAVKNAIPTDITGRVLDPDENYILNWDAPERDEHLFAEHSNYHDFEGCMMTAGWERVLHVPFDVAKEARDDYLDAHVDYKYRSRVEPPPPPTSKDETYEGFGDINE